jgi:hypothetical protein
VKHLFRSLRAPRHEGPRHLLFAFCDHYEPLADEVLHEQGVKRVQTWVDAYPQLANGYTDSSGRPPQHSFFFPGDQYAPEYLEQLSGLVRDGYGEVEIHLHHDGDTEASLRGLLDKAVADFSRHGHLGRDPSGRPRYAFIHGNWCLANSRADGRHCGVDAELPLLWDTGCYADFTFPASPSECQPNIVNQIYWPTGDLRRRRAYEWGERARVGHTKADRVLLIQGPLAIASKPGAIARIESGDLQGNDGADANRVKTWVNQNIHVEGRPDWVFVKVHTHGAPERNAATLLGASWHALHSALAKYNDGHKWHLHYVTAREMYNIAKAAMNGAEGDPGKFRDYEILPPPILAARRQSAL